MKSLYISRVVIKNYRNFKNVDVKLGHKEVIIGENNIGKTNFLRALQLVLDPTLSDDDRMLDESDFNDTLIDPVKNGEEILIQIYISNYSRNKTILAILQDATVKNADGEEELLITYRYFPMKDMDNTGKSEYQYNIFMGKHEDKKFGAYERKFLNIKVIKALRDVEGEMRNTRTSPVKKMLDDYAIDKERLARIAEEYKKNGEEILDLDEIIDLTSNINKRFSTIIGNKDFNVSLQAMEVDPTKVLASLKLLMANRNTSNISLGINNILYISMVLQMLQDKTVPSFLKKEKYDELITNEGSSILEEVYKVVSSGNYFLKDIISEEKEKEIYNFMDKNFPINKGVTILAIEEPEAHLHPVNQRLIYKDVIKNNNSSVLLTTHSTHITSIAPVESIVHLLHKNGEGTNINATADMPMEEGEFLDMERYLDVKRGEIYLGKAVILVEGIAEEYLVPRFAEILGKPLDEKGIIVCNVNCTNFTPYVKVLSNLGIPYTIITDGDFYYIPKGKEERKYHIMSNQISEEDKYGFLGLEVIKRMIKSLGVKIEEEIPEDFSEENEMYRSLGIFVGNYTFEVDMMENSYEKQDATNVFINLFNELTTGGETQKKNFKDQLEAQEYWKCLAKIESNGIGKGRFAQKLAGRCLEEHIPEYIESAINYIYEKVVV